MNWTKLNEGLYLGIGFALGSCAINGCFDLLSKAVQIWLVLR